MQVLVIYFNYNMYYIIYITYNTLCTLYPPGFDSLFRAPTPVRLAQYIRNLEVFAGIVYLRVLITPRPDIHKAQISFQSGESEAGRGDGNLSSEDSDLTPRNQNLRKLGKFEGFGDGGLGE